MRLNNLEVTFHRTVLVAEGRAPSNLPPSLGRIRLYKVSDYRKNCPEEWADDSYFLSLHETEAMWISFGAHGSPCAVLVGAGGVNALTGQKLGTKLEKDNYLVCPPQPWIDGWKDVDGTVHQFVATPHKKGSGITVGEQILGTESQTGAIGLAIFDPKDDAKLKQTSVPHQGYTSSAESSVTFDSVYGGGAVMDCAFEDAGKGHEFPEEQHWPGGIVPDTCFKSNKPTTFNYATPPRKSKTAGQPQATGPKKSLGFKSMLRSAIRPAEMGIGKGGKITQKIYTDPHGLDVWKPKPTVVFAFYLVDAKTAEEITGEKVGNPVSYAGYAGHWFGVQDEKLPDVAGTSVFSGLKSAAFTGDISNAKEEVAPQEQLPVGSKA